MSKRISKEKARKLFEKEQELIQMQKDGIDLPQSDRRRKKYLLRLKKEQGYIAYLKERYRKTGRADLIKKLEN